ncbi:hypothetical protein PMAYCL1PPCAC_33031, partial [Pristionchus mayeri]
TLLFFAVILRSPIFLGSYKVLLMSSALTDLLSATTMLLGMPRLLPARHAMAYIYAGPCVFTSSFFCHIVYTIMCATLDHSLYIVACSFAYRLYILDRPTPRYRTVLILCLIVAIPSLILQTTFTVILDDPDDVRAEI